MAKVAVFLFIRRIVFLPANWHRINFNDRKSLKIFHPLIHFKLLIYGQP